MSEEELGMKARDAIRHIRNLLMQSGRFPSVRELMAAMEYKSPRSAVLLLEELERNGFLEKRDSGGYRLVKDLASGAVTRTIAVPLVGEVSCGLPLLAEENIEAMIPVSTTLARPGSRYFLLKARGDSMDMAGIFHGDLLLVRQQSVAENGERVVALIDDEATVKEIQKGREFVTLVPRSSNPRHQPIIATRELIIQGVVVASIPKVIN